VKDLVEAVLPLPNVPAWYLAPMSEVCSFSGQADPRPDAFDKIGVWAPEEDLAVHNRIHVIPRERDLGFVASPQTLGVEVWNAFLNRAQIMDEITSEGPEGVEVIDHLGQPAHFAGSDSQIYEVMVLAQGSPTIDNIITWVFLGIDPSGTTIRILGFRLLPWVFEPDLSIPITERYGYLTDLIEAFSGMEQRIQLREKAVGSIGYMVTFTDLRELQMAIAMLEGNQGRAFGVPRWPFRTPLTVGANPGDLELMCDTIDLPFEEGGLICLWRNAFTWEVQTIASIAVDRLNLEAPLENAWPANLTVVLPMVIGRVSEDEAATWLNLSYGQITLTFDIDGFKP